MAESRLQLSMDYGTKNLSVAYRIVEDGVEQYQRPDEIEFDSGKNYAPQQIAWISDDLFYWGWGVDTAIHQGLVNAEDVIEYWKLLLYKNHTSSPIAKEVTARLKGRSIIDLISKHLTHVIQYVIKALKSDQILHLELNEVDRMPIELFLSVPLMWHPNARLTMAKAAEQAGIPKIELVYEPQCAAATFSANAQRSRTLKLSVGDQLAIVDVGGGTADCVTYELLSSTLRGANVDLKAVGEPKGALCGSEFVTRNFVRWFKSQTPDFEDQCAKLRRSPAYVIKDACDRFEIIKCAFEGGYHQTGTITIVGGFDAVVDHWVVTASSPVIKSFFDPVIAEIKACIDTQVNKKTAALIIPGGFGDSKYLMRELRDRYGKMFMVLERSKAALGNCQPVSCGALYRYREISARGLPSTTSFGIAQMEKFDPAKHPDATLPSRSAVKDVHRLADRKKVDVDEYDKELIVRERWYPILKKGDLASPDQEFFSAEKWFETWQQFAVEKKQKSISIQLYWTQLDIKKHQSIRVGKDALTDLKTGIHEWGEPLEWDVGNLKEVGYPLQEACNGKQVYQIQVRLRLTSDGANIHVGCEIAKPGHGGYDENGQRRDGPAIMLKTRKCTRTIWDQRYNPTVRETAS